MRTTIELSNELHARVWALAAARGDKGISAIVAAALADYLGREAKGDAAVADALDRLGRLPERSAERMRQALGGWRDAWRS